MRTVEWSPKAEADYYAIIDYLLTNWSVKEAQRFFDQVNQIERILKIGNIEFKQSSYRDIHIVTLNKHISLLYLILSKNRVKLIRFWDNRQNPSNLIR